jgi:CheY-like chemotaxis protein
VDGLTQFSHKQQEFNYQPLDLMEIIRDIHQLISTSFDKRIDITMEGPDNLLIQGDRSDLSHVLMNLCTNAHDAMPDGGKLAIKAWQEKDAAIIEISDTGLGMDPETVEKCFDPFYTTKEFDKGTGLGLSTAYGIVKDHGGDIWVHSEPDGGTTFSLTFPLVEPIEEPLPDTSMELVPGKGQKILFVDDEMEMLVPLVDLLEGLGYRVTSVNNAKDAISVFKSWHPDLVLLDRNMPIMDGIDCAKNILRYDTDAVIVLISGYEEDGPNGIDERTRAMIKAYLTKPIKIAELSQTLAKVLE